MPGADLRRSEFTGVRMREADLRGSDISSIDPLNAEIKGARIDFAQATVIAEALGLRVG